MEFPHGSLLGRFKLAHKQWFVRVLLGAAGLTVSLALTGCGNFFVYPGSTTSTTTSSNSGDDYVYVSNSATGTNYINGYKVSSAGALTATTSSPYNLQYTPKAMAITPNDLFLYVASDGLLNGGAGYLYGYQIGSGGALSILTNGNNGSALESEDITAMDISSDGNWLFLLDADGATIEYYSINSSTGALTYGATVTYTGASGGAVTPTSIKVAPSTDFVAAALGTGGLLTFPFNTSSGLSGPGQTLVSPATAANGFYAVTVDKNNNIYASGTYGVNSTPGVLVYSSTSAGVATLVNEYAAAPGPNSIAINPANSYLYTANENTSSTSGSISPYSIAAGPVLTPLTDATAPEDVGAIGIDSTGSFVLAAGYSGTAGLQVYSIGSTGALTAVSGGSEPTSTTAIPAVMALTH